MDWLTWNTNSLVFRGIGIFGVDSPLAPDIEIQQLAVVWLALRDGAISTLYGNSENNIKLHGCIEGAAL